MENRDIVTLLHEMGHFMYTIFSDCKYDFNSGTNVSRDFVEFPSQIIENFAYEAKWLKEIGKHIQTGEQISDELVKKIVDSEKFRVGNFLKRQLLFGISDFNVHSIRNPIENGVDFENYQIKKYAPEESNDSVGIFPSFQHIFSNTYHTGYYSYVWTDILAVDGFMPFRESDDIYNTEIANKLRTEILSKDSTENSFVMYKSYRGSVPTPDSSLKHKKLII